MTFAAENIYQIRRANLYKIVYVAHVEKAAIELILHDNQSVLPVPTDLHVFDETSSKLITYNIRLLWLGIISSGRALA